MFRVCWLIISLLSTLLFASTELHVSHNAGFYDSSFYLKANIDSGTLLYSYDNSFRYPLREFPDSLHINKNRAISFARKEGKKITPLGSNSYFISFDTKIKVVSINIKKSYLYDSNSGIYVAGAAAYYDTTDTVDGEFIKNANFLKKLERKNFVEIFDESGKRVISQDAGLRIFGGMTRYYPEKSLRLVARKKYGDSKFRADIFSNGYDKQKHLVLRHSGNDFLKTRFKDAFATSIAGDAGLDVQASSPAHLFVNSEYWGVYNIREKIGDDYLKRHHDIPKTNIDLLQGNSQIHKGSRQSYKKLKTFIKTHDLSLAKNYKYVSQKMDLENFTNFWIHQIYFANADVRGNIRWWRSDSLDGKFRWIVYDTDLSFILENVSRDYLRDFTSPKETRWYNPTWTTFMLRNLLKNSEFRTYFINQSAYLFSTSLTEKPLLDKLDNFEKIYAPEMKIHHDNRKRFQRYQGSYKKWKKSVDEIREFITKRTNYSYEHLEKKFDLKDPYTVKISINDTAGGKLFVNNNRFMKKDYVGKFYFSTKTPFRITANLGYTKKVTSRKVTGKDGRVDSLIAVVDFIPKAKSQYPVIINEIDHRGNALELFNQSNRDINISNWQFTGNNEKSYKIDNLIIPGKSFRVFSKKQKHSGESDSFTTEWAFKINSDDKIQLYDINGYKVDSVQFNIEDDKKSIFSRTLPFDTLKNYTIQWSNSSNSSLGKHNPEYLTILEMIEEQRKRFVLAMSLVAAILVVTLGTILFSIIWDRAKK